MKAGLVSTHSAAVYLLRFYRGASVDTKLSAPQTQGRYFYNDDLSGFNFSSEQHRLDDVLAALEKLESDPSPAAIYVGSTAVDTCLPGLRAGNDLSLGDRDPLVSIWIGNRSRIAAHHDVPDNIACVAAGRRRFTVFPPQQLENLYVGPIDFNPAGQAVSLVDFANPDYEKYPRFAEALRHAKVAGLGPGDAIFIPSLLRTSRPMRAVRCRLWMKRWPMRCARRSSSDWAVSPRCGACRARAGNPTRPCRS